MTPETASVINNIIDCVFWITVLWLFWKYVW